MFVSSLHVQVPPPAQPPQEPPSQPNQVGKASAAARIFGAGNFDVGRNDSGETSSVQPSTGMRSTMDPSGNMDVSRNTGMNDWTNGSADVINFVYEPVQDLEPPPPLHLSPLEMARLVVHCSDGTDDLATTAANALRRRSSLLSSHPPPQKSDSSLNPSSPSATSSTAGVIPNAPLMSVPRFESWCSEVDRVTRRLLNDVEQVRNSAASLVAKELNGLNGFQADELQG